VEEITITISTCEDTGALVASWDDPTGSSGLTTQAERLSDLEQNIREAVAVHFEPGERPKHLRLHFVNDPVLGSGVKLPRSVSGADVIRALERADFTILRDPAEGSFRSKLPTRRPACGDS
jgi:predicted RNase H-like HicB family nuclease